MGHTIQSVKAAMQNTAGVQRAVLGEIQRVCPNWITDIQLCAFLGKPKSFERTVRMAIQAMRKNKIPICSESGLGYRWPEELKDTNTTVAELRSRAKSMWETADAIEQGAIELFGGQKGF